MEPPAAGDFRCGRFNLIFELNISSALKYKVHQEIENTQNLRIL